MTGLNESLKKEIYEITHTEPYTHKTLLEDPDAMKKKKDELKDQLKAYQEYKKQLDEEISKMLTNGGITIQWRMK